MRTKAIGTYLSQENKIYKTAGVFKKLRLNPYHLAAGAGAGALIGSYGSDDNASTADKASNIAMASLGGLAIGSAFGRRAFNKALKKGK